MRRYAFPAFAALMLLLPALPVPDFWITQSNMVGLYSIVALGLVLLTGVAGLTSFGQAAFVGVRSTCYRLAMIGGQLIGARLGSGLVLKHGAGLIRGGFLAVVLTLILKLLWQA